MVSINEKYAPNPRAVTDQQVLLLADPLAAMRAAGPKPYGDSMTAINNFNIEELENEVLMVMDDLYQMDIPNWISDHRGAPELYAEVQAYGYYDFGIPRIRKLKWFSRVGDDEFEATGLIIVEIEENAREAISFLTRKEIVLKSICPALSRVTDDGFALAKQITPVIVTLALSGAVAIPLNPLFIALVALMVTRMGVAKLCGDKAAA